MSRQCRGQALSIVELLYLYNAENTEKKRKERAFHNSLHTSLFRITCKKKSLTGLAAQSPAPITLTGYFANLAVGAACFDVVLLFRHNQSAAFSNCTENGVINKSV